MKQTIEITARTVNEAIDEGLKRLGVSLDEADVKIISQGGLFKKAKIEITAGKDEPAAPVTEKILVEREPAAHKSVQVTAQAEEQKPEEKKTEEPKTEPALKFHVQPEENRAEKPTEERRRPAERRDNIKDRKREPRESIPATKEQLEKSEAFLSGLLPLMGVEGTIAVTEKDGVDIKIETPDSAVIGYRGEVLDSIQYLTSVLLNERNGQKYVHVNVDALDYRQKRIETLERLAAKTADKCLKSNRRVSLEPMTSAERRVIHAALSDNDKVVTRSEGNEPNRRIVVMPARK